MTSFQVPIPRLSHLVPARPETFSLEPESSRIGDYSQASTKLLPSFRVILLEILRADLTTRTSRGRKRQRSMHEYQATADSQSSRLVYRSNTAEELAYISDYRQRRILNRRSHELPATPCNVSSVPSAITKYHDMRRVDRHEGLFRRN
jgi:hypothetical protein